MRIVLCALIAQIVIFGLVLLATQRIAPAKVSSVAVEMLGWGIAAWLAAGMVYFVGVWLLTPSVLLGVLALHRASSKKAS